MAARMVKVSVYYVPTECHESFSKDSSCYPFTQQLLFLAQFNKGSEAYFKYM